MEKIMAHICHCLFLLGYELYHPLNPGFAIAQSVIPDTLQQTFFQEPLALLC